MSAVVLRAISKSYGDLRVIRDISLSLEPGRFYALLGENGAGKSTLMRILARYEQADSGTGSIFDISLGEDRSEAARYIGYVSEMIDLSYPVPLRNYLSCFSKLYPDWDPRLAAQIIDSLDIDLDRHFRQLSRGQRIQVSFLLATARRPRLLLIDEMTAVLDANIRAKFVDQIALFVRDGGTVLVATNIITELKKHPDHLIILDKGRLRVDRPMHDLKRMFSKLRRKPGMQQAVFQDAECVEIFLNADSSATFLIPNESLAKYPPDEEVFDRRQIMPEDIFLYYSRHAGQDR